LSIRADDVRVETEELRLLDTGKKRHVEALHEFVCCERIVEGYG
jgi:hypothetical protein